MDTTKIIIKHINFVSLNLYKITNLEDFEHKKTELEINGLIIAFEKSREINKTKSRKWSLNLT